MKEYIDEIKKIACDYHKPLTDESITLWINQFEEEDKAFMLQEVTNILKKTYLSKDSAKKVFEVFIQNSITTHSFSNEEEFFDNVTFLSCQEDYKSQSILLEMINAIAQSEYNKEIRVNDFNKKYWIYVDDNLSTGGTFFKNIKEKIDAYTIEKFDENNTKLLSWFFYLHDWGYSSKNFLLQKLYPKLKRKMFFSYSHKITNNPNINYYNNSPRFNCTYIKFFDDDRTNEYLNSLPEKLSYDTMYNKKHAFRPNDRPKYETFFTSTEARDKYEKIILEKGLDILDKVEDVGASTRPLGFTTPSHQTLGLGSHVFTWRNTSNTCPIVYWWEGNGWTPLFPIQNRGLAI